MKYEEADRPPLPPPGTSWRMDGLAQQIRDTVTSGRALKVPFDDPQARNIAGGLSQHLKKQGFKVHRIRGEGDFYLVWADKIEQNGQEAAR